MVKNSSVPWLEHELGQVREVHCTRVLIPRTGSRSPRLRPVRPVPAMHRSASSSSESGTGAYGLAYSNTSEPTVIPRPTRRLLRSKTVWKNGYARASISPGGAPGWRSDDGLAPPSGTSRSPFIVLLRYWPVLRRWRGSVNRTVSASGAAPSRAAGFHCRMSSGDAPRALRRHGRAAGDEGACGGRLGLTAAGRGATAPPAQVPPEASMRDFPWERTASPRLWMPTTRGRNVREDPETPRRRGHVPGPTQKPAPVQTEGNRRRGSVSGQIHLTARARGAFRDERAWPRSGGRPAAAAAPPRWRA